MNTILKMILAALCAIMLTACGQREDEQARIALRNMLAQKDYDGLEKSLAQAHAKYLSGKLPSNQWAGQFQALATMGSKFKGQFDRWVSEKKSGYAHLARGMFLQQQAWLARGSEPSAETSDAQFAALRKLAAQARPDLTMANEKIEGCAICAGELIGNNRALNERATDRELLDKALSQDPKMWLPILEYYQGIYPKWESYDEIQAFIAEMRIKVKDPELDANLESRMYRDHGKQALSNNQIDRVKLATAWYEQGVNKHPHDLLLKELAALYADKGDYQRASELLELNLKTNDSADVSTIETLAKVYVELGQYKKSEKMIARQEEIQRSYQSAE